MLRQIKVADLCNELEEKLVDLQYSEDSMRRYRKVFQEFKEYAGNYDYSQSKGTDFLLWKFKQLGGFVTSGEHSKNEMYCITSVQFDLWLNTSTSAHFFGDMITMVKSFGRFPLRR